MSKKYFFIVLIAVTFFSGCDIINPEEEIPAYIAIPNFKVTTDPVDQGSDSENISDAWIYIDDQLQAIVEIPVTVPILTKGNHKLSIVAGIKENGLSSTRVQYPFYQVYDTNISLNAATVDTVIPSIEYKEATKFALLEDFEGGNNFTGMSSVSDPSLVFEGNRSGYVKLDELNPTFLATSSLHNLPKGGTPVWLELNYKNSINYNVSVIVHNFIAGTSENKYLVTVTQKSAWSKIYLNLTSVVSGNPTANAYSIRFSAAKPDTVATAEFLWDNIKIVHF